jgi:2-oxoisovalerate dehydrogenase E1 component
LPDVEKAMDELFDEDEIICEIICPIQLYPLNPVPVIESVEKSGRLIAVEEGLSFAAFGGEVAAQILEAAPGVLRHFRRLGSPRHPIPACGPLERQLLPGVTHVKKAVLEVMEVG